MKTIAELQAELEAQRAIIEAIDKKREEECKALTEAIERIKKEQDALKEREWKLRDAVREMESSTSEARAAARESMRSLKYKIESLEKEAKKADIRSLLSTCAGGFDEVAVQMFKILLDFGWDRRPYDSKSVRVIKHPTHNIVAATSGNCRYYFAYDKQDRLVSALTAIGGGHRGAYVDIDVWGCKSKIPYGKTRSGDDQPWCDCYRNPQGFREWAATGTDKDEKNLAFGTEPLSEEQMQELFKALHIQQDAE